MNGAGRQRRSVGAVVVRAWLAALLALSVMVQGTAANHQDREGTVDRAVQDVAQRRPQETVRVFVQARTARDAESAARGSAGVVRQSLPEIGAVATELRAGDAAAVAKRPGVKRIALDPQVRVTGPLLDDKDEGDKEGRDNSRPAFVAPDAIGANQLWARGITGKGIGIAVLDSGVQSRPDFGTPSRVTASERFNRGASSAADQYGHGTWVAGIAAGDGRSSGGRYTGIAPGANVINLKVSDDTGMAYTSDVIRAVFWAIQNRQQHNIRVMNLSLLSSLQEGYATSLLAASVEMAWHSGIVVIASAGNAGGARTVRSAPANDPYIVTVGATDDRATKQVSDDALAWFSSFGPTPDGFAKPDVVAPGRRLVGALASPGSRLAKEYASKVVDRQYIQLSGTSAAAPVVSGAVALILQAKPQATPDQVKWLLARTARGVGGDRAGTGAGQVDAYAAATYSGSLDRANKGLSPNRLVELAYRALTGRTSGNVSWDSVSWDSVSWDSVSWDSVSWDSVSWDSVSWDSVSWSNVFGD